jgi:hypothetical protein
VAGQEEGEGEARDRGIGGVPAWVAALLECGEALIDGRTDALRESLYGIDKQAAKQRQSEEQ